MTATTVAAPEPPEEGAKDRDKRIQTEGLAAHSGKKEEEDNDAAAVRPPVVATEQFPRSNQQRCISGYVKYLISFLQGKFRFLLILL